MCLARFRHLSIERDRRAYYHWDLGGPERRTRHRRVEVVCALPLETLEGKPIRAALTLAGSSSSRALSLSSSASRPCELVLAYDGRKLVTEFSFILPDYPSTTKRFSAHDRIFAQYRMDRDFGEGTVVMKDVTAMHGLRMAVKDIRTWIFGESASDVQTGSDHAV